MKQAKNTHIQWRGMSSFLHHFMASPRGGGAAHRKSGVASLRLAVFSPSLWAHSTVWRLYFSTTLSHICFLIFNMTHRHKILRWFHGGIHIWKGFPWSLPDNVPGLIPYGIGTGHHRHTGPVRARATPIKSCMGPMRDCPWFTHSKVKWFTRTDLVRETKGHHGHACTGPAQIPVRARSNPVIGLVRDSTGHSGHARSNLNPVRAPARYLGCAFHRKLQVPSTSQHGRGDLRCGPLMIWGGGGGKNENWFIFSMGMPFENCWDLFFSLTLYQIRLSIFFPGEGPPIFFSDFLWVFPQIINGCPLSTSKP